MRRCSLLQNIILSYNLYEKLLLCSLAKLSFKVTNIIGVFHGAIQTGSKIVQYQIGHRGRGRTPSWFDNDLGSFRFFFLDWKIKSIRYLGEMILLFSPYHVTLWTHHRFVAGISI